MTYRAGIPVVVSDKACQFFTLEETIDNEGIDKLYRVASIIAQTASESTFQLNIWRRDGNRLERDGESTIDAVFRIRRDYDLRVKWIVFD